MNAPLTGLFEDPTDDLGVVDVETRAAIADAPANSRDHQDLLDSLPFARTLEARTGSATGELKAAGRIAAWNLERGKHLAASAELLDRSGADVMLLSELDWGMARSGQHHTARALSDRLGCGYAYAVEFLELGLGNGSETEQHAGQRNEVGYHGCAILSRVPLSRPAFVRLEADGDWFDGSRGERRIGGRVAVVATVRLAGIDVTFAAVHLESHGDPEGRAAQLRELIEYLDGYRHGAPTLIGGDLNTLSFGAKDMANSSRLRELFGEDPTRLIDPVPHEPMFTVASEYGYDWRACNALHVATHRASDGATSHRTGAKIDWFLSRGLHATNPAVLEATETHNGPALSDHEPLTVEISVDANR